MTWRTEKTRIGQDLIWDGVQSGIAPSPTLGTANIQNANISTETGEVLASYGRTNQAQLAISAGTLTASVSDGAILLAAPATLNAGTWVKVASSTITSISAFTPAPSTVSVDYLVVAGGGGGGTSFATAGGGGGGGAGAVRSGSLSVSATSYPITIGAGGAGATTNQGTNGSDSVFSSITSTGGGGGGFGNSSSGALLNGKNGGSGGGGGGADSASGTAGAGTTGGNNGGAGRSSSIESGGGGGGSGAVGSVGASGAGGAGGVGTSSSITGVATFYGGGGGGGSTSSGGVGGNGGGGAGSINGVAPTSGTANTGGGGGGSGDSNASATNGAPGGSGIVAISYTTGTMIATGGSITIYGTKTVHTFTATGTFTVVQMNPTGYYYVSYKDTNNKIKLSASYDPTGAHALTHGTSGTATFDTVTTVGSAIAKSTEKYTTSTTTEYRYYILDINGYVWVYDTSVYKSSLIASGVGTLWMLPDPVSYSTLKFTGMANLDGWLMVVSNSKVFGKPTVNLGTPFIALTNMYLNEPFPTHINFAYVGSQGKMYYCDGNYIGEIFPTTSLLTSLANIQSYSSYTAVTTVGTVSAVINGSLPYTQNTSGTSARIPAVFFTDQYGTIPTAISANIVYWIEVNLESATFAVYTASTGGSAIDIATGATGNNYFNTFFPSGTDAGYLGAHSTLQFSPQRVNLPTFETTQCLIEIGNTINIGCNGSIIYPWNQIDATPSDFIALPEGNVKTMVNVNNTVYAFAGNKANIYITNNSSATGILKVPDYCSGIPGTPLTYIEPVFTWGDAMYIRGRVYFSLLDQSSTKSGNCGGVWSFIPSSNPIPGLDLGSGLRLENQNSYGDYDGVATILIGNEEQNLTSPQYWSAWQDSYSTGTSTFGIDQTGTTPVTKYIIETDLLTTGTLLAQRTFSQVEYDLTTPLTSGDSVQLYFRLNSTGAWTTCGTVNEETTNRLSGYFKQAFEKTQRLQLRAEVTTGGTTSSSFGRLKELRLR